MALYQRSISGEGQQVDVSVFECVVQATIQHNPTWGTGRPGPKRGEEVTSGRAHLAKLLYPCKDGYVSFSHGGPNRLSPSLPLVKWMEREGFTNDFLKNFNWESPEFAATPQEDMDRIEEPTGKFFMSHTKAELLDGAVKYNVMLYPVSTADDILESVQLAARGFWVKMEHRELGTTVSYPGSFARTSEASPGILRRAPLIGEHSQEVEAELSLPRGKRGRVGRCRA